MEKISSIEAKSTLSWESNVSVSEDESRTDEQPIGEGEEEEEEVIEDPQPLGKFRFQANRKRVKGDQAFLICSEGKCVRPSSLLNVEPKQVYSLSQT